MPRPAAIIAATVNCQKYFFTIIFAVSLKRHNNAATMPNRAVRNMPDTIKNNHSGNPKNPAHSAINLYGIGVTADRAMIMTPCCRNISLAISNFSVVAKFWTSHTPTESNKYIPITYVIAPPINDPNAAATAIGNARRLFETIGGVINTSGGTNKNIDSHTVSTNTIPEYAGCSDFLRIFSMIFIVRTVRSKIFLDCIYFSTNLQYQILKQRRLNAEKTVEFESRGPHCVKGTDAGCGNLA